MAGSYQYGVADGSGPLLLHTSGQTTGGMTTGGQTTGGMTTGGMTTGGMTTGGTTTSTSVSSYAPSGMEQYGQYGQISAAKIGIAKILPGISASSASAGTGFGILTAMAVVGGILLTGAVFAGVGLLSYAITKAAIEPSSD